MELKDPMFDLLSSLEQIVFKDKPQTVTRSQKSNPFTEFERLRKGTGMKTDDFASNGCQRSNGSGVGI